MKRVLLLLCAVTLCSVPALAQNESGYRQIPNAQLFKDMGYWYDSSTAMYQTRYPIIRTIPPLAPSMPFDVMLAYVATDSLCKFGNLKELRSLVKGWESMNDTLRYAAKWLYRMMDYDPIIFQQYEDEVTYRRGTIFQTDLSTVRGDVQDRYVKLVPEAERNAVYSLVMSDYILRVRVVAVDSMERKNWKGLFRYRVTADVLDTLKGKVFQTCGSTPAPSIAAAAPPCMHFQYTTTNYQTATGVLWAGGYARYVPSYRYQDSAFVRGWDKFGMSVGQEAIVFVTLGNRKIDNEADYYDVDMSQSCSYNALPIIDGKVRDVNSVWSANLWLPYGDWKARFIELRDKILNAAY